MAQTFFKTPRGAFIVAHKNYDKENNATDNIKIYAIKKAFAYSRASPRYVVNRAAGKKLDIKKVNEIKNLLSRKKSGECDLTIKQIADKFKVSEMQIYRIQNGDGWKHTGPALKKKQRPQKLTPETVKRIKKHLGEKKLTGRQIAKIFNINPTRISRIKNAKYYNE